MTFLANMRELYKNPKSTEKTAMPDLHTIKYKSSFEDALNAPSDLVLHHVKSASRIPSEPPLCPLLSTEAIATPSLHRFVGKGDKVCIAKAENISVPCAGSQRLVSKSDVGADKGSEVIGDTKDQIASGESLFKSYQFDPLPNDEETEKCIAFWKSVVKKNLEPLKCSIIENTKARSQSRSEDALESTEKTSEIIKKAEKQKLEQKERRRKDALMEIWVNTLQELQRRRLHQIKLIGKARCKMCESVSSNLSIEKPDPAVIKQELKDLNSWKSKSKKSKKYVSDVQDLSDPSGSEIKVSSKNRQLKKTEKKLSKEQLISSQEYEDVETPPKKEVIEVNSIVIKQIREDSEKFKYVDAIEEKKKSGAYTDWRENKLTSECPCGVSNCDCDKNPAIISVQIVRDGEELPEELKNPECVVKKFFDEVTVEPRQRPTYGSVTSKGTDEGGLHLISSFPEEPGSNYPSSLNLPDNRPSDDRSSKPLARRSILTTDEQRYSARQKAARAISIIMQCTCGEQDCDCQELCEVIQREVVDSLELPEPPKVARKSTLRRDSLELTRGLRRSSRNVAEDKVRFSTVNSLHAMSAYSESDYGGGKDSAHIGEGEEGGDSNSEHGEGEHVENMEEKCEGNVDESGGNKDKEHNEESGHGEEREQHEYPVEELQEKDATEGISD